MNISILLLYNTNYIIENGKTDYCKHFGIEPDYVNESPLIKGTKKPFFNLLLDDRAGLKEAYTLLIKIIDYANSKSDRSKEK